MHDNEFNINERLITDLLKQQCPELAEFPIAKVKHYGTDNAIFRIGDEYAKAVLIGIGAGLGFSLAGLFIRQATLILDGSAIISAALTLVTMIAIQIVILGAWIVYSNRNAFRQILQHLKPSILVGLASTLGSIGWFTAFALTNAAYVKTVGQIELIFALLISHKIFKETINKSEIAGMALVVGSIFLLVYFY